MRKLIAFLLVFVCIGGVDGQSVEKRECVVANYTAEIGVREASGKNDGDAVGRYLASTNLGEGYAWCAAFVNWCIVQECIDGPVSAAWSPAWFPNSKIVYDRSTSARAIVDKGDVFGIYFSSKKRIAHVGFVDEWTGGDYMITVEGNTNDAGSREGDGVYRKRRLKRQVYQVSNWID